MIKTDIYGKQTSTDDISSDKDLSTADSNDKTSGATDHAT
jgi:hypothetical protein